MQCLQHLRRQLAYEVRCEERTIRDRTLAWVNDAEQSAGLLQRLLQAAERACRIQRLQDSGRIASKVRTHSLPEWGSRELDQSAR